MKSTFRIPRGVGRRVVFVGALLLCIVVVLGAIYIWEHQHDDEVVFPSDSSQDERSEIYADGKKYALNNDVESILLIGVDKYDDEIKGSYINNQMADMIMLMVVDHKAQSYTLLQLNRDTMTSIETLGITGDSGGKITAQLALAHAYGTGGSDSDRNTVNAVSNLLYNVPIEYYASIRMDAIPILNDAVGGVEVELIDDFTSLDPLFTKGSVVTLKGDHATAYVQARGELDDKTNIHRLDRQRQYISSWFSKFQEYSEKDDTFVANTAMSVSEYLNTDLSTDQFDSLSQTLSAYTSNGIQTIAGESVKGDEYMEFHVDDKALQAQVLQLFYEPVE